jgi:hypothetical protein
MNQKNFYQYTYYLAFATSAILIVAFILGLKWFDGIAILRNVVWLALITSALGTFFGLAARSEWKRREPSPEERNLVKIGLRTNIAALAFMILAVILAVGSAFLLR